MQTLTYSFLDKSTWGDGPWQSEPDKRQFTDEITGLPCLAVRNGAGTWCGYVGVDERHPAFNKHYDDVDVNCHGGLTFSDFCSGDERGICHVVDPGENDRVWWLGFDCYHGGDYAPESVAMLKRTGFYSRWGEPPEPEHYWTLPEVQAECAELAKQLSVISS